MTPLFPNTYILGKRVFPKVCFPNLTHLFTYFSQKIDIKGKHGFPIGKAYGVLGMLSQRRLEMLIAQTVVVVIGIALLIYVSRFYEVR
jgi:hypothetical protein